MSEIQGVTDPTEQAFRRHYAEVYRFVRRRTHSDADAEDLAQQVFTSASLRCDGRPPIAWLYAVAERQSVDAARRDARRRRHPTAGSITIIESTEPFSVWALPTMAPPPGYVSISERGWGTPRVGDVYVQVISDPLGGGVSDQVVDFARSLAPLPAS